MQHFTLHFEPENTVLYQEPRSGFYKARWKDIATSPYIPRIQYNTKEYQNYIIVDIDNKDIYKYRGKLPEPNFIVKNKDGSGGHLFWVLDRTIATPKFKRVWTDTFKLFTKICGGDENNKGFIGKNINNNIDFDIEFIEPIAYDINALKALTYTEPIKKEKKLSRANMKPKQKQLIVTTGRNVEIFNKVRLMAYEEIKRSTNENDFSSIVYNYAAKSNLSYQYPLEEKELETIVDSIVRYCLKNKTQISKYTKKRGRMELDENLDLKEKQRLSANYSSKLKATKTELKIKVALIEMKKQELKINISSVAEYTKMTRKTIRKYKGFLI